MPKPATAALFNREAENRACGWKIPTVAREFDCVCSPASPENGLADGIFLFGSLNRRRYFHPKGQKKGFRMKNKKLPAAYGQSAEPIAHLELCVKNL